MLTHWGVTGKLALGRRCYAIIVRLANGTRVVGNRYFQQLGLVVCFHAEQSVTRQSRQFNGNLRTPKETCCTRVLVDARRIGVLGVQAIPKVNRFQFMFEAFDPFHDREYTRSLANFNSLDAQREAGEAFILSQRHEGWQMLPARYDDGGFSGGTMERPALKRLL